MKQMIVNNDMREKLLNIVLEAFVTDKPLYTGDGRLISDYINGHYILGHPQGLDLCIRLFWEVIEKTGAEAVCGLATGSCGLVSGLVLHAWHLGKELPGFYLRKESKAYGFTGDMGVYISPGTKIFIVDDVTSQGTAARYCIDLLRKNGLIPVGFMSIIDRDEGAREVFKSLNVPFYYLYTLGELAKAERKGEHLIKFLYPIQPD